jgi:RimJ/RimL family protein N-acetyltransferase
MYAWRNSFSKKETEEWIYHQLKRYEKDGYGYFAVMLKETNQLIGQTGLMKNKIEVMYAWGKPFSEEETEEWIYRQLKRYEKDGYGYFAVILKATNQLIGQTGLMKNKIENKEITEIGYIFDNNYWKKGYCIESVKGCIKYAFETLKIKELYGTIRPGNISSIKIIEKVGMEKIGNFIKIYENKKMEHNIYRLKNNAPKE